MAISLQSYCLHGLSAFPVMVEVDVASGMPMFSIIGMAGTSVQEAKDRVRSAMVSSGYKFPLTRKIVNLAPAELPKHGSHFDLPMALGFLVASEQMPELAQGVMALGELSLDGALKPVKGILPGVLFAKEHGVKEVILPYENLEEASLVEGVTLFPAGHLREVVGHFGGQRLESAHGSERSGGDMGKLGFAEGVDFSDISGHTAAKRALLVAAAGGHHVLMSGPPGSGKSLLAQAFLSVLPPLSREELLEVWRVYSVAGHGVQKWGGARPLRSVHHRASSYVLLGGGNDLQPGEVSLAHRGVLFMDEFPEFEREALEALREPLEAHRISFKRGKVSCEYPCKFQLVAAMNPCPCGFLGDPVKRCTCTAAGLSRYCRRISGPLLDRIDLHITVPRLSFEELKGREAENSRVLRERVVAARERQRARLGPFGLFVNQEMPAKLVKAEPLDSKCEELLKTAAHHHALSGRAIHRLIKVALTLADLDDRDKITPEHLMEALQYRVKTP